MKNYLKFAMISIVALCLSCRNEIDLEESERNPKEDNLSDIQTRSSGVGCIEGVDGCLPMLSFSYDS